MLNTDEHEDEENETVRNLEDDFEKTEDDALPLDCSICGKPFLDPLVTKCHHFFCEQCALKSFMKHHHTENNKCFVCNEPTLGVFNTAVEIKKIIAEEREKARAMVKEVSEMVEKASAMVDDAGSVAEKAVKIVEEVETLVAKAAAKRLRWFKKLEIRWRRLSPIWRRRLRL